MFDLFRRKDTAVRYLLVGLLGLVAISMVITLIPGYGSPSSAPEQVLAEVDGEAITIRQVQQRLQAMMRSQNMPSEMLSFYVPQMVDQIINEEALAYQAKEMGFEVSDEDVAQVIRGMFAPVFPNGEFKRDVYERFLAQQGTTVNEFERGVRRSILLTRMSNLPVEGVVVTPDEVTREYKRRNDKVALDYIMYTPGNVKAQVQVTPEEVKRHYEQNKASYMTPERKTFDVLIADEAKIAAALNVPEDELRKLYQQNIDRYRTPERVKIRHILISTQDKSKEEQAQAEQKAADLLKQIKGGADFAELAKKHSQDPGSAQLGGDVGWVSQNGQMVKPFEDAAMKLKPKEISPLVKTDFGWHILQATERESARQKPFEEVKAELAAESQKQIVFDKLQNLIEQARAQLEKSPNQAQEIANKLGLIHVRADRVTAGAAIPELGNADAVQNALAGLSPGQVSQVFQPSPSRLAVVSLQSVEAPKQAEFAEVEGKVRQDLIDFRAKALASTRTQEAENKMRAGKNDFAAAAKSMGLTPKTTQPFGTEGAAEGIGPATYFLEAFQSPVGTVIGPVVIGENVILARVAQKQEADMSKLAAERETLVTAIKRRKSAERRELFEDGLVTQLIKEGKVKKYPEAIKRLVSNYQG